MSDNEFDFSEESVEDYDQATGEPEVSTESALTPFDGDSSVGVDLENFAPASSVDLDTAVPLTYEEAVVLTEHIRATADVLYVLVQRAHAGRAWEALGYDSFGSYVTSEFNISRSRAYQLLNQANIIAQIQDAAPEGTQISINEATARDLKSMVDELVPEIEAATDGLRPEDAESVIEEMIARFREEARAGKDADSEDESSEGDDLFPSFEGDEDGLGGFDANYFTGGEGEHAGGGQPGGFTGDFFDGSGDGGGHSTSDGNVETDNFDPDFDAFDELFAGDEDPRETRKRLEDVYNLYNALSALKNMRNFEEMVELIPQERRIQITASLPVAVEWLNNFNEHWNRQPWVSDIVTEEVEESEGDEGEDLFGDL